ncbi:hypothetical protein [Zunongwangia sp.]|uniref:hypothetical protein n=1 Tax=Zunongwangia sp. TaxID=1965325 RepID=UPI003AA8AE94
MSIKKHLLALSFIGFIISTLINYYGSQTGYYIMSGIMILTTSFLFLKELKVVTNYSIAFMFDLRTDFFNKKIERPRLLVYLIFGAFSVLFIVQYITLDKRLFLERYYISTLIITVYTACNFFLFYTWHPNFEKSFIPKSRKKILTKSNRLYELKWQKNELMSIYQSLAYNNLIELIDVNSNEIDYKLFANIIYNGNVPEEPSFNLNMNQVDTKYFKDVLAAGDRNFTFNVFLKIFKNKNKTPNPRSLSAAYKREENKGRKPPHKSEIDNAFTC